MSLYEEFLKEENAPVIFADFSGMITAVNQKFEETFLWPAVKLKGKPLNTIIPTDLHDSHNMGFSRYLLSGQDTLLNTPLALQIQLGNGEIILAEHLIVALEKDGEKHFAAKITPR